MALLSWSLSMTPKLPLLSSPQPPNTAGQHSFGLDHPTVQGKDLEGSAKQSKNMLDQHHIETEEHEQEKEHGDGSGTLVGGQKGEMEGRKEWDGTNKEEVDRVDAGFEGTDGVTRHLSEFDRIALSTASTDTKT